jgi:hypothetical protein
MFSEYREIWYNAIKIEDMKIKLPMKNIRAVFLYRGEGKVWHL